MKQLRGQEEAHSTASSLGTVLMAVRSQCPMPLCKSCWVPRRVLPSPLPFISTGKSLYP